MQIEISSNQHDIVSGGMAYLFHKDADLTISIKADNGYCFSVVLKFVEDSAREQAVQSDMQGQDLFLTCYNFQKSGTGLSEPVQIASIEGKEMYLMFWSYLDGDEKDREQVRSVRYTLFY